MSDPLVGYAPPPGGWAPGEELKYVDNARNQALADVTAAYSKASADYDAHISNEKATAIAEINSYNTDRDNSFTAKVRELSNQLAGFMTGAVAPAYQTTTAGSLERNPYKAQDVAQNWLADHAQPADASAGKGGQVVALAAVAWLAFHVFFKKRRR